MFNTTDTTHSAERLLAGIAKLAPEITARSPEIEAARRVPSDIVEGLRAIGVFRTFAPRSHGGMELDLPAALDVIRALAKIDGSIGWTAMIGAGGALVAASAPRDTYERMYANGPDLIIGGSALRGGTAEKTPGGWHVSGRWPFASGAHHADWMLGVCVMTESGKPIPGPSGANGPPLIRGFFLEGREWEIEDTWHVLGLKGTGSNHIALKDKFVPEENFLDLANQVPCVPGPLYQAVSPLIPLMHGPIAVGIAEGALDELVAQANTGWQQQRSTVAARETDVFQTEVGRVAADIRAARAFFEDQVESHWRHALAGTLNDSARVIEANQTVIWLAHTCLRAVQSCFALGGSSAIYESSPLQRRLRDLQTAAQHAVVQQRHYVTAGKLLLDTSAKRASALG
jgi:alkylation response protein AidB-like acyl-CoA dehydrogenase